MPYLTEIWFNILQGRKTNWEFFITLNSGWLEMEFQQRYGSNPSEQERWEWMCKNAEIIRVSPENYEKLLELLNDEDTRRTGTFQNQKLFDMCYDV